MEKKSISIEYLPKNLNDIELKNFTKLLGKLYDLDKEKDKENFEKLFIVNKKETYFDVNFKNFSLYSDKISCSILTDIAQKCEVTNIELSPKDDCVIFTFGIIEINLTSSFSDKNNLKYENIANKQKINYYNSMVYRLNKYQELLVRDIIIRLLSIFSLIITNLDFIIYDANNSQFLLNIKNFDEYINIKNLCQTFCFDTYNEFYKIKDIYYVKKDKGFIFEIISSSNNIHLMENENKKKKKKF
jgi:hypothetical protein